MTTPTGAIGLSDVNIELGKASNAAISLNDSDVRSLAGIPSGAIALSDLRGKSVGFVVNLTISANTQNYNLKSAAIAAGWNQVLPLIATVTVNAGVYVYSSATNIYAFQTGTTFPSGSRLTLINNGVIEGRGGNGGGQNGGVGTAAGPALLASYQLYVTNNGTVGGGGGGGGGGGQATGYTYMTYVPKQGQQIVYVPGPNGGAGGGGRANGAAGGSGAGAGSLTAAGGGQAGGGGGAGAGGAGGNLGSNGANGANGGAQAGGAGGSAGSAIAGNSNIIWTVTGTRLGAIT